ncbi:3-oxoacyl-[acyl-carrier protein] reductase [Pedobacter sp. UYEF25]
MNLQTAKVIVTGGTSGIGYETAKLLKENGAEVVICGRDEKMVKEVTTELNIFGIVADVSKGKDVESLFDFAFEKMGDLNVLINNAGVGFMGSLVETTIEDFSRIWDVNTKSVFMCGQKAAKHFIQKNTGNIINISSMGAVSGFANGSAYVSSKAAITGLTMCWRAELRKHNVRVMQVNPSEVVTPFIQKLGYVSANAEKKLKGLEIAQVMVSMLQLNDIGFIPEVNVWATNP